MRVSDWMHAPVLVVEARTTVEEALKQMRDNRLRRLPVMSSGTLVGIVTRTDLEYRIHASPEIRPDSPVEEAMTGTVVTVRPDDLIEDAADLLLQRRIEGLPVVRDGTVVGMLTVTDVLRAFAGMLGVSEKGTRLSLTLPDSKDLLAGIQKAIPHLLVRTMVAMHNEAGKRFDIVVKARGRREEGHGGGSGARTPPR